jgi:hypothetical protein
MVALLSVLAFAGVITLLALEGQEVVRLRTFDADGGAHETRTWIADDGGYFWIEAATPERPFLRRLEANAAVEVVRGERVRRCRASAVPNPGGHDFIRRRLAQKYGWADWWIGWLQDTSASVAVRLEPLD